MSNAPTLEIRCLSCQRWFPSPIFAGDAQTFDATTIYGNVVQCPHCQEMTGCNKENMRVDYGESGFRGKDTV